MAQPSKRLRGLKARKPLWKNGLLAAGAGAGLLVLAAAVAGKHPVVASAVSMPAWWTLGLGALLILLHLASRLAGKRRPSHIPQPAPTRPRQAPQPAGALMALIDQLERETLGTDATPPLEPGADLRRAPSVIWREEVLTALNPDAFVALCEALFAQAGYVTRRAEQTHGRGTTIWLDVPDMPGSVAAVLCQPVKDCQVESADIQALQANIATHGLRWGVSITPGNHSAPAMAVAARSGIHVLGAHDLQLLISRRSAEQQADLLQVAQGHPDNT